MDLTKQGSSETSCEENHQPEKVKGVRTYNCTFCKRGFTNAQALGGHMNIHRKQKTKAKKVICQDQSSWLYQHKAKNALDWNNVADNSESFSSIVSTYHRQHHHHHHHQYLKYKSLALEAQRVNYQMHFSTTNSSFFPSNLGSARPHGSYTAKNLSMRFGPVLVGDGEGEDRNKGVDLELRLGRNP